MSYATILSKMPNDQNSAQLSDEELALRVQKGNKEAFATLLEHFERKLLRYGNRFLSNRQDIEDIVQDVFMAAYQNIHSFDASQRFSPWIYRIAHNKFVDALKEKSRTPLVLFDFDTLFSHHVYDESSETEREQGEMRKMIDKGLEKIPLKYREILILHYLEELKYKEIADVLHIPTGTVGIRLKRAKEALKKVYTSMDLQYGS